MGELPDEMGNCPFAYPILWICDITRLDNILTKIVYEKSNNFQDFNARFFKFLEKST
jgi:hypothetical protein